LLNRPGNKRKIFDFGLTWDEGAGKELFFS